MLYEERERDAMTSTRKTSVIVGLLFLTQTVAFIIAEQLINGVVKGPDFVTSAAAHVDALVAGGLLAAVSGVAVVGISVMLFPVLKGTSEPMALAYVCERVVELVLQILFFLIVPLMLIRIGNDLHAGTIDASLSPSLSAPLKNLLDVGVVVLYLVTSVGGTILGVLLYRSRLVPRWLAILALVGYPMLFLGCVLDLFGSGDVTHGVGLLAIAPGGLFELILPIWLLAKGFNARGEVASSTASPQSVSVG